MYSPCRRTRKPDQYSELLKRVTFLSSEASRRGAHANVEIVARSAENEKGAGRPALDRSAGFGIQLHAIGFTGPASFPANVPRPVDQPRTGSVAFDANLRHRS